MWRKEAMIRDGDSDWREVWRKEDTVTEGMEG